MKSKLQYTSLLVIILLTVGVNYCYANDPPHNMAGSIDCSDCHGMTLLNSQSPFYTDNTSDLVYNALCLRCHESGGIPVAYDTGNEYHGLTAPKVATHAPDGTVIKCTVCHHNHDQYQIYKGKNEPDKFFIGQADGVNAFSGVEPNTTDIVFDPASWIGTGEWADPANLAKKTGDGRGAMLVPDYRSRKRWSVYIIKSVDTGTNTITIKGNVSSAPNIGIFYGQVIHTSINYEPVVGMPKSVKFYNNTGTNGFAHNGNPGGLDSSINGICQVCHTQTEHFRNNPDNPGPDPNHANVSQLDDDNPNMEFENCVFCHNHLDGFGPSCTYCHGVPPTSSLPGGPDGLVKEPADFPASGKSAAFDQTGSVTEGMHTLHATPAGYNYPCQTCHYNGMTMTMIKDDAMLDDQIQIGFNTFGIDVLMQTNYDSLQNLNLPYSYLGIQLPGGILINTTVTTPATGGGGTGRCSNVYCHSKAEIFGRGSEAPSTSPAWDGTDPDPQGDGNRCNNCHDFPSTFDTHGNHVNVRYDNCSICHYGTSSDGRSITNKKLHANGRYDVIPGPSYRKNGSYRPNDFNYSFAPGGGTCSNITCHLRSGVNFTRTWQYY